MAIASGVAVIIAMIIMFIIMVHIGELAFDFVSIEAAIVLHLEFHLDHHTDDKGTIALVKFGVAVCSDGDAADIPITGQGDRETLNEAIEFATGIGATVIIAAAAEAMAGFDLSDGDAIAVKVCLDTNAYRKVTMILIKFSLGGGGVLLTTDGPSADQAIG